jgi:hypothetical protein
MARADLLPSLRVKVDELRQEQAEMLFSRDDRVVVEASRTLEAAYRAGAVLAFLLDGSLDGFFHGMFLAASVRRRLLRAVRGGLSCDAGELAAARDDALREALCGGEPGVLRDLAVDPLTMGPGGGEPHRRFFALGLRRLCLGDRDGARPLLTSFEQARGEAMEGESLAAQGLLDGDGARLDEGLSLALGEHVPPDDAAGIRAVEQFVSVEHLALARLGRILGVGVTLSHPLLPRVLLGRPRTAAPDPEKVLPPLRG